MNYMADRFQLFKYLKFIVRRVLENIAIDSVALVVLLESVKNLSLQLLLLHLRILGLVDHLQGLGSLV